jgi:hypothetical protein
MTQDEIIEMARQAGWSKEYLEIGDERLEAFAKLVADNKEAEMQERIYTLQAMYEQICKQNEMVSAMRREMQ